MASIKEVFFFRRQSWVQVFFFTAEIQGRKRLARESPVWLCTEVTDGHSGLGGDVQIEKEMKK